MGTSLLRGDSKERATFDELDEGGLVAVRVDRVGEKA